MSNQVTTTASKQAKQQQCVFIGKEVHGELVTHVNKKDGIIYKFVERAIKEKIERETPKA